MSGWRFAPHGWVVMRRCRDLEVDGGGVIVSAVANTGTIEANGGTLTLQAAVTGSGVVTVASGTLDIANADAAENVAFTGRVSGFSLGGKTWLHLKDIDYVDPGEATFSGDADGACSPSPTGPTPPASL